MTIQLRGQLKAQKNSQVLELALMASTIQVGLM